MENNITKTIASHFRTVYTGGNWTFVNLKDTLAGISWQQAVHKVDSLNTIAVLVFHINYYVEAIINVLKGNQLDAHDKFSFDCPPIQSQQDWDALVNKTFANADIFIALAEQLPENKLWEIFGDQKYGTYYRNLHGVIEHTHYHLGQIALLKKIILGTKKG